MPSPNPTATPPTLNHSEWLVLRRALLAEILRLHTRTKRIRAGRVKRIRPAAHAMEVAEVQMLFDKVKAYTNTLLER